MEKATLKAVNHPFLATILEDNPRYFYDGTYLNTGDKFHSHIHIHEYYLEVIEATSNGLRFDTTAELNMIND